jgi:hypothetical protein
MSPVSPDNVEKRGDSPNEQSRSPIAAAQVEQVERTQRKTWSRARSEFLCPTASDKLDQSVQKQVREREEHGPNLPRE